MIEVECGQLGFGTSGGMVQFGAYYIGDTFVGSMWQKSSFSGTAHLSTMEYLPTYL